MKLDNSVILCFIYNQKQPTCKMSISQGKQILCPDISATIHMVIAIARNISACGRGDDDNDDCWGLTCIISAISGKTHVVDCKQ